MLSRDVVRLSQKIKKSLAELSSRHLAFGYDCPRPDYSGDKKKRKHQSMEGNIRTSDIRTARFKQLSLSCRQPNQGNRMIHVVVRGRVITLIQPVSQFPLPAGPGGA